MLVSFSNPFTAIHGSVDLSERVKDLLTRYVPSVSTIPLTQGMTWYPTWKATPTKLKAVRYGPRKKYSAKSFFSAFPFEVSAFFQQMKDCPYLGIGAGVLWYPRVRYCFDPNNDLFSLEDHDLFTREVLPNNPYGRHFSPNTSFV